MDGEVEVAQVVVCMIDPRTSRLGEGGIAVHGASKSVNGGSGLDQGQPEQRSVANGERRERVESVMAGERPASGSRRRGIVAGPRYGRYRLGRCCAVPPALPWGRPASSVLV